MPAPKMPQKAPTCGPREGPGLGVIVWDGVAAPCMFRITPQAMHEDDAASLVTNARNSVDGTMDADIAMSDWSSDHKTSPQPCKPSTDVAPSDWKEFAENGTGY